MNKLFFAVVIYNKNFDNSITCKQLDKILNDQEKVIIADNSTKANDIEKKCLEKKWTYIAMQGNKGISFAYNSIIEHIKNKENDYQNDIIVFLDDDTKITEDYISKLKIQVKQNNDINIFMPIIKEKNNLIISPSKYTKLRNVRLKDEKQIKKLKQKEYLAINTCLAIRMKIFKDYSYTTKLFLDCVDNQFFYDMRERREKFLCVYSEIKQNFFSTSNKEYDKEITRKRIQKKDYKNFVEDKSLIEKILYYFRILFWKVRGCIKYKTFKYFVDLK